MSHWRRIVASTGTAVVLTGSFIAVALPRATAASKQHQVHSNQVPLQRVGTFSFSSTPSSTHGTSSQSSTEVPPRPTPNPRLRHQHAAGTPDVTPTAITSTSPATGGFAGINHLQQRYAGSGDPTYQDTQFSTIPSDQGLCVGNGFVGESVNSALTFYNSTTGEDVTPVMPFNEFFGGGKLAPEVTRNTPTPVYGPELGDPTCYYDAPTGHWFISVYELNIDSSSGALTTPSSSLVAVSSGSDPTTSTWTTYSVDTTDSSNPNCPCFGDHPVIGADAYGFYIAEDEFNFAGSYFKGSQIFAFSKTALETGTATTAVQINTADVSGWPYSLPPFLLWPSQSPTASDFATAGGGTEYFLSTLDLSGGLLLGTQASAIGVWGLTNTSSLTTNDPDVSLSFHSLSSELYSQEPNSVQKVGPYPLGQGDYNSILGYKVHGAEEMIETDEDEMSQVVYADGTLWGATNTGVKEPTGATRSGIAWFAVSPSVSSNGTLSATMAGQGYVAAPGQDLSYPSIATTSTGAAGMVMDLSGPDFYPAVAYTTLRTSGVAPIASGSVQVVKESPVPADTFGGYEVFKYQPGLTRWGDYTAAVADTSGNIWIAGSWVPGNNLCVPKDGNIDNCPPDANRSLLANWGSWVAEVPTTS
jgi:hypothetical protein